MTGGCVTKPQSWAVAPVELVLPPEAEQPCDLPLIDPRADMAALEAAYMQRGAALLACEAKRALVVEILKQERRLRVSPSR